MVKTSLFGIQTEKMISFCQKNIQDYALSNNRQTTIKDMWNTSINVGPSQLEELEMIRKKAYGTA